MDRGNVSAGSCVALGPMRKGALRRPPRARRWAALPAVLPAFALLACGTSSTECLCADRSIHVKVPDARAASVLDVATSGAACVAAKPTCAATNGAGACTSYRIAPTTSGPCHVDVDFSAGGPRFSADLRVVAVGGCCAGFVADPASAADVDVPDDDAGARDAAGDA